MTAHIFASDLVENADMGIAPLNLSEQLSFFTGTVPDEILRKKEIRL